MATQYYDELRNKNIAYEKEAGNGQIPAGTMLSINKAYTKPDLSSFSVARAKPLFSPEELSKIKANFKPVGQSGGISTGQATNTTKGPDIKRDYKSELAGYDPAQANQSPVVDSKSVIPNSISEQPSSSNIVGSLMDLQYGALETAANTVTTLGSIPIPFTGESISSGLDKVGNLATIGVAKAFGKWSGKPYKEILKGMNELDARTKGLNPIEKNRVLSTIATSNIPLSEYTQENFNNLNRSAEDYTYSPNKTVGNVAQGIGNVVGGIAQTMYGAVRGAKMVEASQSITNPIVKNAVGAFGKILSLGDTLKKGEVIRNTAKISLLSGIDSMLFSKGKDPLWEGAKGAFFGAVVPGTGYAVSKAVKPSTNDILFQFGKGVEGFNKTVDDGLKKFANILVETKAYGKNAKETAKKASELTDTLQTIVQTTAKEADDTILKGRKIGEYKPEIFDTLYDDFDNAKIGTKASGGSTYNTGKQMIGNVESNYINQQNPIAKENFIKNIKNREDLAHYNEYRDKLSELIYTSAKSRNIKTDLLLKGDESVSQLRRIFKDVILKNSNVSETEAILREISSSGVMNFKDNKAPSIVEGLFNQMFARAKGIKKGDKYVGGLSDIVPEVAMTREKFHDLLVGGSKVYEIRHGKNGLAEAVPKAPNAINSVMGAVADSFTSDFKTGGWGISGLIRSGKTLATTARLGGSSLKNKALGRADKLKVDGKWTNISKEKLPQTNISDIQKDVDFQRAIDKEMNRIEAIKAQRASMIDTTPANPTENVIPLGPETKSVKRPILPDVETKSMVDKTVNNVDKTEQPAKKKIAERKLQTPIDTVDNRIKNEKTNKNVEKDAMRIKKLEEKRISSGLSIDEQIELNSTLDRIKGTKYLTPLLILGAGQLIKNNKNNKK